jgi:hypothetical protein
LRNAIAIADGGRGAEVRYLGEFPSTEAAIRKLMAKLAAKYRHLTFCYRYPTRVSRDKQPKVDAAPRQCVE